MVHLVATQKEDIMKELVISKALLLLKNKNHLESTVKTKHRLNDLSAPLPPSVTAKNWPLLTTRLWPPHPSFLHLILDQATIHYIIQSIKTVVLVRWHTILINQSSNRTILTFLFSLLSPLWLSFRHFSFRFSFSYLVSRPTNQLID